MFQIDRWYSKRFINIIPFLAQLFNLTVPVIMAEEIELLPPTLQNILDQTSLKWIFCGMSDIVLEIINLQLPSGGKGGVGKRLQFL